MTLHKTIGDLCNGYMAAISYCEEELCRLESSPHRRHLQQEWDLIEGALSQYRRELGYWSKQNPSDKSWYAVPTITMAYADEIMRRSKDEV